MNAQEYMAEQIERMGPILAHFVEETAPDKLTWQPALEGSAPTRSVLEQIGECVGVNLVFAALLRGEGGGAPLGAYPIMKITNAQEAREQLIAATRALAEAVRALDDEGLTRTFQTRRGQTTGKNLMMAAYRNMAYHLGQINLIQLLAGDAAFHAPPTWL